MASMKQRLDQIEKRLAPGDEWDHLTDEELDEAIVTLRSSLGLLPDGDASKATSIEPRAT